MSNNDEFEEQLRSAIGRIVDETSPGAPSAPNGDAPSSGGRSRRKSLLAVVAVLLVASVSSLALVRSNTGDEVIYTSPASTPAQAQVRHDAVLQVAVPNQSILTVTVTNLPFLPRATEVRQQFSVVQPRLTDEFSLAQLVRSDPVAASRSWCKERVYMLDNDVQASESAVCQMRYESENQMGTTYREWRSDDHDIPIDFITLSGGDWTLVLPRLWSGGTEPVDIASVREILERATVGSGLDGRFETSLSLVTETTCLVACINIYSADLSELQLLAANVVESSAGIETMADPSHTRVTFQLGADCDEVQEWVDSNGNATASAICTPDAAIVVAGGGTEQVPYQVSVS